MDGWSSARRVESRAGSRGPRGLPRRRRPRSMATGHITHRGRRAGLTLALDRAYMRMVETICSGAVGPESWSRPPSPRRRGPGCRGSSAGLERALLATGGPLSHDALSGLPAPRSRLHAPASPCSCLAKNPRHLAAYDRVDAPHVRRAFPAHARAANTLRSANQRICSRPLSGEHAAEHRRDPRRSRRHDRALLVAARRTAPTPGNSTPCTHAPETTPPRGSSPRGGLTRCCQREWLLEQDLNLRPGD